MRDSSVLSEAQKARISAKLGPRVTAVAQDARSQARNRDLALQRLAQRLRDALHVPRPRTKTKPTAGASDVVWMTSAAAPRPRKAAAAPRRRLVRFLTAGHGLRRAGRARLTGPGGHVAPSRSGRHIVSSGIAGVAASGWPTSTGARTCSKPELGVEAGAVGAAEEQRVGGAELRGALEALPPSRGGRGPRRGGCG